MAKISTLSCILNFVNCHLPLVRLKGMLKDTDFEPVQCTCMSWIQTVPADFKQCFLETSHGLHAEPYGSRQSQEQLPPKILNHQLLIKLLVIKSAWEFGK